MSFQAHNKDVMIHVTTSQLEMFPCLYTHYV